MAYKLIEAAQTRWRKVNARRTRGSGARFHKGKLLERPRRYHTRIINRPSRNHRDGGP